MSEILRNQFTIRRAELSDVPFILAIWLNHFKNHSYFAMRIRKDIYYLWHEKIVKSILSRSGSNVLLATLPDDKDVLLGFIALEMLQDHPPVIHFCYVKEPFRCMGIATALVEEAAININDCVFTHWTFDCSQLVKKYKGLIYNPYRI